MTIISQEEFMLDLEEGASEGVEADYMAAEMSGDYGEWIAYDVEYKCDGCGHVRSMIMDQFSDTEDFRDVRNKQETKLNRISKRLKRRVGRTKEYKVIYDDADVTPGFAPAMSFGIDFLDFEEAKKLKRRLLRKYKGKTLDDIIGGKVLEIDGGSCYHIQRIEPIDFNMIDPEIARKRILSDFKLLYGIGEVFEGKLKGEGYESIEDLADHPRFGWEASEFLKVIDSCDIYQIIEQIGRWLTKSHPLVLYSSGFHKDKDFVILDIETMGLFGRPIILFGVAHINDGKIIVDQYLVRDIEEQPAALSCFLSHVGEKSAFMSYNGRTFDIPYIAQRLAYYGMHSDLDKPHYDLLHFSRRQWRGKFPNCKLTTIEKHVFGIDRIDDVPGALVPGFYETYREKQNIGPLIPIIEHNQQDIITLAKIFSKLHEEWG